MRGESLGTRLPPTRPVSPRSPSRVYTRVMLMGIDRPPRYSTSTVKTRPRAVLGAASAIHFLHDGFSETLYVFLPLWAKEFGLSFAQVGLIRSTYTGGMSAFQIPAGFLAERFGGRWLLAGGTGGSVVRAAQEPPLPPGWGIRDGRGFSALCAIGMIDNATRTGFLTFMPFILIAKDLGVGGVGLAFSLVFIGGATGKFVCGVIAERVGVIRTVVLTEAATTLLILVVVAAPLPLALDVLIPLGIALNGTSSVLYATVADLVSSERRSRAYGLYYTTTIAASALAPTIWGFIGDLTGVPMTLSMVAIVVLATIPLCLVLRPAVTAPASA